MDGAAHRGVSVLRSVPSVGRTTELVTTTSFPLLWSVWSLVMWTSGQKDFLCWALAPYDNHTSLNNYSLTSAKKQGNSVIFVIVSVFLFYTRFWATFKKKKKQHT